MFIKKIFSIFTLAFFIQAVIASNAYSFLCSSLASINVGFINYFF